MSSSDLHQFCQDIITGTGGLHDFERDEFAIRNGEPDVAVAEWVIRCLGNNPDPKVDAVLEAIMERRRALEPGERVQRAGGVGIRSE